MSTEMQTVDARGMNCPMPILQLKKTVKTLEAGAVVRLLSTDPGSVKDVEAFCRQTGCDLLSTANDGDAHVFDIRKN